MANIKIALYNLVPNAVLALLRTVIAGLTGNANFPVPKVPLADMQAMADELEDAITKASRGDRQARILRDNLVLDARDMLKTQADYVRSECNRDLAKLESSGYPIAREPRRIDKVGMPEHVKAATGVAPGDVEFSWRSVHGAHMYQMWKATVDAQGNMVWASLGMTTRTRNVITGLESHQLYAFRVNALGVNGAGLVSVIAQAVSA